MGIGWIGSFERSDTAPPCILPPLPYPICCSDSSAAVTVSITKLITTRTNKQLITVNFIIFICPLFSEWYYQNLFWLRLFEIYYKIILLIYLINSRSICKC